MGYDTVVGYVYDADHHCKDCTIADTQNGVLTMAVDANPNRWNWEDGFIDRERNFISPIFEYEECDYQMTCADCHTELPTSINCYCDNAMIECQVVNEDEHYNA